MLGPTSTCVINTAGDNLKGYLFYNYPYFFFLYLVADPPYAIYLDYLESPYYKFIRDTMSYLILVSLHFALCLEPTTKEMSGLEWTILTFFIGRYLVERKQIRQQRATYLR